MPSLRVMTYNILQGGGRRGAALAEVVRAVAPDVLLVTECPKTPVVSQRRARAMAEEWGLRWVVGGRDAGANMIAVSERVSVKSASAHVLRQPPFLPRRGLAVAQLRFDGRIFGAVACHLPLSRARRSQDVHRLLERTQVLRGPVILGGDLNEPPDGPSWRSLRKAGYVDHGSDKWLTYPSDMPARRIDAILLRGTGTVVHHGDPGAPEAPQVAASDHRPVLAVLDL
jgi:endonuclease/exonuclease/phosphatase family metal-dependent hydrolase